MPVWTRTDSIPPERHSAVKCPPTRPTPDNGTPTVDTSNCRSSLVRVSRRSGREHRKGLPHAVSQSGDLGACACWGRLSISSSRSPTGRLSRTFVEHSCRPIEVEHQDIDGTTRITVFERGMARMVCHEVDHLFGMLYRTRMKPGVEPIPVSKYQGTGSSGSTGDGRSAEGPAGQKDLSADYALRLEAHSHAGAIRGRPAPSRAQVMRWRRCRGIPPGRG